jgi:hypothetical protein
MRIQIFQASRTASMFIWVLSFCLSIMAISADANTWYVKAGAEPGGNGSENKPFDSLAQVEAASSPDDTIFVLHAPANRPALVGGIVLKDNQKLIGTGPNVTQVSPNAARAKITNSLGDGVTLANDNEVTNLHILDTGRSAVFGLNVDEAFIHGNLITGYNRGEHILSTFGGTLGYHGIQLIANSDGNEFNYIVNDNVVRDAESGGINLNCTGSVATEILLNGNALMDITLDAPFERVRAIQIGAADGAIVEGTVQNTFVDNIGSGNSNSDGMIFAIGGQSFAPSSQRRSQIDIVVKHYTYRNTKGVGGTSATGIEAILFFGDGELSLRVEDSDIKGSNAPGIQVVNVGGINSN